jgi:hypothetical protein
VNTYKETDMSENNAFPEAAPVEVPATEAPNESVDASVAPPASTESTPAPVVTPEVSTEQTTPAEPVAGEAPNAEPAAPASVAESAPVTRVDRIASLSDEAAEFMHAAFQYIHQGFDQHSLMIGMSRFYEIARAVKARAEAVQ